MSLELAKGTRDLYPEECLLLEEITSVLKRNFALFGFNPLDTPILERYDTLASKYAGGVEILKETFRLTDQGKRELGLRYDLTVPFSRFVAMNPQLKMPFKRYQIGRVFRDGPVSTNRLREFTQCDCDVVGTKSIAADAECVLLYLQCFSDLGLDIIVRVNNRKILDDILRTLDISEALRDSVMLAVDKLDKKSQKEVEEEIVALGISAAVVAKLFSVFRFEGNNAEVVEKIASLVGESVGVQEVKELLRYCPSKKVQFVPSLARGLSYYTGTIFEVYLKDGSIPNSIGSGGRYDAMIGSFVGGSQEYPAVGCSFGLDVIVNALRAKRKELRKSAVQVYVVPIGVDVKKIFSIVEELRDAGVATDVGFDKKGVSKNLDYADKYSIPYVLLIGEDELKKKKVKLKDMKSGKEKLLAISSVIRELKK